MNTERPWYKKKRYIATLGLLSLWAIGAASSNPASITRNTVAPTKTVQQPVQSPITPTRPIRSPYYGEQLSNDSYYVNSRGNTVHSPAFAPNRPSGASAQCRDGTYSFSQSRRGTCSHHGGVDEWY